MPNKADAFFYSGSDLTATSLYAVDSLPHSSLRNFMDPFLGYVWIHDIHPSHFLDSLNLPTTFPVRIWEAPTQSPSQHCSSSRCQSAHSRIRDRPRIHLDDDRIDGYHRGHLRFFNDFQIAVGIFWGGVGVVMVYPSSELCCLYCFQWPTSFLPPTNRSHLPRASSPSPPPPLPQAAHMAAAAAPWQGSNVNKKLTLTSPVGSGWTGHCSKS